MSFDPTSIEADLRRVRPAGLDAALLDRLDACARDTWAEPKPEEIRLERQLQAIAPAKLPPALMAALESSLRGTPFPNDQTIVCFPVRTPTPAPPRSNWLGMGAAAAVALAGAVTALLVPVNQGHDQTAGTRPHHHALAPAPDTGELIPAGFNSGLSETSDEGVVWQSNARPHRVLKVVYKERVTLKDSAGRTYQVEQPRVEYILVPAKTD